MPTIGPPLNWVWRSNRIDTRDQTYKKGGALGWQSHSPGKRNWRAERAPNVVDDRAT